MRAAQPGGFDDGIVDRFLIVRQVIAETGDILLDGPREQRGVLRQIADEARQPFRIPVLHVRSEEHTSELQSLMRISYAVFCLKKKTNKQMHNPQLKSTTHTILNNQNKNT